MNKGGLRGSGVQNHYVKFTGGDGPSFKLNYWKYE